ncbi:MAG: hypothetical protein B6I23_02300 [Rickettsiaceae bacterium 4572_127]|nr:MAG: hypothetical protein B6I23_02300 [Rickettsiaceae bacterium 4572_127]
MLDSKIIQTFNRRALLLGAGKTVVLFSLIGRIFYLQVMEKKKYQHLSNRNSFRLHILVPPRGKIFDRYNEILADNTRKYSLFIKPSESNTTLEKLFGFLSQFI